MKQLSWITKGNALLIIVLDWPLQEMYFVLRKLWSINNNNNNINTSQFLNSL